MQAARAAPRIADGSLRGRARTFLRARRAARYRAGVRRRLDETNPIVVYSLEKTGTSSLVASLNSSTSRGAIKAHSISRPGIERRTLTYRSVEPDRLHRVLQNGRCLQREIRRDAHRRWDMICGVRDPVARAISGYFNHYDKRREVAGFLNQALDIEGAVRSSIRLHAESDWFIEDLLAVTGVDVYASPFDVERGWQLYEADRFRVLLLRFEDLRRVAPFAVARGFDLPGPIRLLDRNTGDKHPEYEEFRSSIRFDEALLRAAYATRQVEHFYSTAEIERFIDHWSV